jgi:hypothetical protein
MSRSPEGAGVAARALTRTEEAISAVLAAVGSGGGGAGDVDAAAGAVAKADTAAAVAELGIEGLGLEPKQADPKQAANVAKIDRENVLVLLTELLRNRAEGLTEDHKTKLENALRAGGEIVLSEKARRDGTGGSA